MKRLVEFWLKPELYGLDFVHAHYAARRFAPHWHDGFSIAVITRHAHGFHHGGRLWIAGPGDLVVLNPGEPHDGHALCREGWSTRSVFVPPTVFSTFAGVDTDDLRFPRPVIHAPLLADLFVRWHRRSKSADDLARLDDTRPLFAALSTCMREEHRSDAPDIWQVLADIDGGPREAARGAHPYTVARLAANLARSRTTAWRYAKACTGFAPKSLLNQLQLDCAKKILVSGRSVVDAAVGSGYHDQSHFTRRFTAAYGVTPALFRRARLSLRTSASPSA